MAQQARIIEMVFNTDGSMALETTGYTGTDCLKASLPYETALGVKTADHATVSQAPPPVVRAHIQQRRG